ncbi:four helix bundle protein [Pontibacter sp. Tf4]|uniref:four helix bundle protein n=1 Tax=Pontibacter sp. Tf4 TaxID=2761620 RepID=UPI001629CF7E|nr:four helix bundle protein [Pontibacter sp. Tf4]MBB6611929.1 four helix bundle protein [Pontibacter sp. Tf4]
MILTLTLDFAVDIILYAEELEALRKYVVANQLLKSGTSIGANVREAQNAESKADFIHKFKIAAKEVEETEYWLLLCNRAPSYPSPSHLQEKLKSIKRIISKIIISSKYKGNQEE